MPVVVRPLSSIVPSHTKPGLNNRDSRFGFHLPPRRHGQDAIVPPLVAVSSNTPSDSDSSDEDTVDKFEVEDVLIDGSNSSDDELEPVSGPSIAHVRNSFPINAQDQDLMTLITFTTSTTVQKTLCRGTLITAMNLTVTVIKTSVLNTAPIVTVMILHLVRFIFEMVLILISSISKVPGFDQSPSEDEELAQGWLRSPRKYPMNSLPPTD